MTGAVFLNICRLAAAFFTLTITGANSSYAANAIPLNVHEYGAKGDGHTDDSKSIQSAIDAAVRVAGTVFIPKGTYIIDNLNLTSGAKIFGEGTASVLRTKGGPAEKDRSTYAMSANAGKAGSPDPSTNVHDIVISKLQIQGSVSADGFAEHKHLLNLNAISYVLIDGVTFTGFRGDAIYLGSGNIPGVERHNSHVRIIRCLFNGINGQNRNAITVVDGDDILIEHNRFSNTTRPDMPGPIDLEPNTDAGDYAVLRNIFIRHNFFTNCGGSAAIMSFTKNIQLGARFAGLKIIGNHILATNRFKTAAIWVEANELRLLADLQVSDNCILLGPRARPLQLGGVTGGTIVRNDSDNAGASCLHIDDGFVSNTSP